jgi:hypothetical protein
MRTAPSQDPRAARLAFRRRSLRCAPLLAAGLLAACGGSSGSVSNAGTTASVPGAPIGLTATAGDASATLSFSAPASNGGAAITGYRASCGAGGSSRTATGTSSPIVVSGLLNDTTYTCLVAASNSAGTGEAASVSVRPVAAAASAAFTGSIVLGSPTGTSVKANVYSVDQSGTVWLSYGAAPGAYDRQTANGTLTAGTPLEIPLTGLSPQTRYYYRLFFQPAGGSKAGATDESSFHTARTAGSAFTFTIQGDSHPERANTQFNADLYARTLLTAAADNPDFHVASGDDFSVDALDPAAIDAAQVTGRYTLQRPYLGLIGRSAPVYLVNGNHEQAARYLLDGTPDNIAVWAQSARNSYYPEPAPDGFYTGNAEQVPYIGLLRNYYAWTWGDALFVVIDPYWSSPVAVDNVFGGSDKRALMWDVTHGDAQYQWLKTTLEQSRAKYKFVFAHHVMGTGRGGIELARLWEWGGENSKGVNEFAALRPAWSSPIHQLMVANRVTIFFQGHDHVWVHQQLDGVTYQTLSEPADPNYSLYNSDAYTSGDKFPNTGYTRVRVSPTGVTVEYVRTYLPEDEGPGRVNGTVAFGYTIQ